ncbi:MAG: lipoprotein [Bacillota bacterium]
MKKFFVGVCLLMLVSGLAACGEASGTKDEAAASTEKEDEGSATEAAESEHKEEEPAGESESETTEGSVNISSSADAIEYLKHVLELEENEDILFDDMGGTLETDDSGSFYTIKLVSKEMQKNGGSGTVGVYMVYEDGTYMEKI